MKKALLLLLIGCMPLFAFAQHEHYRHDEKAEQDTLSKRQKYDKSDAIPMVMGVMSNAFSRNLPMSRNGSGTGWLPDYSPMEGYMFHTSKWMYMIHGSLYLQYNNQDFTNEGARGSHKIDAPNWFMGMGQTHIGKRGQINFSAMLSLDPLTVGGSGYPLLFQSGETWKGVPLVDHQHPHDLFSELSAAYSYMFSKNTDAFIYIGYPGEPALGPVAFMHRPSAAYNPDAPIGHHWQDATHITFGVTTLGFRYKNFKLEGSNFTGREPDENRYDFDKPRFNSWSARVSYNPGPAWALQVSRGWINDVHETGHREDLIRTTASVIHSLPLSPHSSINSTMVWGYNNPEGGHLSGNSFLMESALNLRNLTLYGKYEFVQKSVEELVLNEATYGDDILFPINAVTLGIQQKIIAHWQTTLSAGIQGTWYKTPDKLTNLYGHNPMAFEIYIRIHPEK